MLEKGTKCTQIGTASLGLRHIYIHILLWQFMNKTYMEAWKACKIFADKLIATEYPLKDPCLKTWYSYMKNIKLLKIGIFQWLPLIFNDFSRQNGNFPGQHQIPWLFKVSLKFHDFSRLVWTMLKWYCEWASVSVICGWVSEWVSERAIHECHWCVNITAYTQVQLPYH